MEDLSEAKEKYPTLERRVKSIEGNNIFGAVVMDMCLVSYLTTLTKFKMRLWEMRRSYVPEEPLGDVQPKYGCSH